MSTEQHIQKQIAQELSIEHIQIYDKSASHKNHPEAQKNGGGHYTLILVSSDFKGLSLIQRQRKIHQILEEDLKRGSSIHALSMKLYTTEEWQKKHEDAE